MLKDCKIDFQAEGKWAKAKVRGKISTQQQTTRNIQSFLERREERGERREERGETLRMKKKRPHLRKNAF